MYLLKCTRIDHFTVNGCCFVFSELFSSWADMIDFRLTLFYYFLKLQYIPGIWKVLDGSRPYTINGLPESYLKVDIYWNLPNSWELISSAVQISKQCFRQTQCLRPYYLSGFILLPISVEWGMTILWTWRHTKYLYCKSYGVSLGNYFFNGFN